MTALGLFLCFMRRLKVIWLAKRLTTSCHVSPGYSQYAGIDDVKRILWCKKNTSHHCFTVDQIYQICCYGTYHLRPAPWWLANGVSQSHTLDSSGLNKFCSLSMARCWVSGLVWVYRAAISTTLQPMVSINSRIFRNLASSVATLCRIL